jgi:protein-S-isoprenylcysteine O-methyltransferase Ste14
LVRTSFSAVNTLLRRLPDPRLAVPRTPLRRRPALGLHGREAPPVAFALRLAPPPGGAVAGARKPFRAKVRAMIRMVLLSVLGSLAFVAFVGACLFVSAGRWDLPWFWAYLAVWAAAMAAGSFLIDPALVQERLRPGPGGKDYGTVIVLSALMLGQSVVAGLDVGRSHWSDGVPPAIRGTGLLAVAAALAVVVWAMAANRFFSPVIRIQTDRGHRLVTSGSYRYVRHPACAAFPLLMVGGPALGSWLAALVGLLLVLPVLRRAAWEDRVLRGQLGGYAAYARQVRYRLFPGVW